MVLKWLKQKQKERRVSKSWKKLAKASKKRIIARGKRIAVQYNIKYTRTFDGKKYHLIEFETHKTSAEEIASDEREAGIPARVTSVNEGYAVYHRKKK